LFDIVTVAIIYIDVAIWIQIYHFCCAATRAFHGGSGPACVQKDLVCLCLGAFPVRQAGPMCKDYLQPLDLPSTLPLLAFYSNARKELWGSDGGFPITTGGAALASPRWTPLTGGGGGGRPQRPQETAASRRPSQRGQRDGLVDPQASEGVARPGGADGGPRGRQSRGRGVATGHGESGTVARVPQTGCHKLVVPAVESHSPPLAAPAAPRAWPSLGAGSGAAGRRWPLDFSASWPSWNTAVRMPSVWMMPTRLQLVGISTALPSATTSFAPAAPRWRRAPGAPPAFALAPPGSSSPTTRVPAPQPPPFDLGSSVSRSTLPFL
jgi:hypothetical protein